MKQESKAPGAKVQGLSSQRPQVMATNRGASVTSPTNAQNN